MNFRVQFTELRFHFLKWRRGRKLRPLEIWFFFLIFLCHLDHQMGIVNRIFKIWDLQGFQSSGLYVFTFSDHRQLGQVRTGGSEPTLRTACRALFLAGKVFKRRTKQDHMNRKIGLAVVIVGLIVLTAGFIPLTREVVVTEEKVKEVTEYREEKKTREEPYTEEIEKLKRKKRYS